ncbi:DNA recombination protein RmuC [bacterium]|nr:DNA recombination protein RmuC [bacterium]
MSLITVILITLLGAALAAAATYVAVSSRSTSQRRELETKLNERGETIARLESRLEAESKGHEEKLAAYADAEKKLSATFESLGGKVLESNAKQFLERAQKELDLVRKDSTGDLEKRKQAIEELVKPLSESLKAVDNKIGEMEKTRAGAYGELMEQVKAMAVAQRELRAETNTLSRALGKTQTQGQWGELQLRRVVEFAGMVKYVDFTEQTTTVERDRPDMVVKLPGGKNIVVDAKAPLEEYYQASNADNETLRNQHLKSFAANVRSRIIALGQKNYWQKLENTPEFVVLFLPAESFFSAALIEEPGLIEIGTDKKVILATPTTLIALLKAVAYGWTQEEVRENAKVISELGRDMHGRVATLADHFDKLGSALTNSVKHYNKAVGSLERQVLPQARKFEELGTGSGKPIKELPPIEETTRDLSAPELLEGSGGEEDDV